MNGPHFDGESNTGNRSSAVRLGWAALVAFGLLAMTAAAAGAEKEFMPYVQLAPFVVNGKQLAISIHARSSRDRRYAEEFAQDVVRVVYEAATESTGKGLVIIGQKREPHPIFVFRKVLALASEGKLDPAVAARGPELDTMLGHWQTEVHAGKSVSIESDGGVDMEFEQIVTALPLPLEGMGAKLYQLAWAEGFDDAKVEAKLRTLHAADLEGSMFARFDWVFYLPPRGALVEVIDNLIADALKKEDTGFFARMAVKGVMLVVKPKIKQAIEAMRHGMMFSAVLHARTPYDETQVSSLTETYIEVLMPDGKGGAGTEHEQAVKAVSDRLKQFETKTKTETTEAEQPAASAE